MITLWNQILLKYEAVEVSWGARVARALFFACCVVALLGSGGCAKKYVNRLEVTVTVQSGGKLYTASGVQETRCYGPSPIAPNLSTGGCQLEGEAIPILIGTKGYLIATMSWAKKCCDPERYPFAIRNGGNKGAPFWRRSWILERQYYPLFVRFSDPSNHLTANVLDDNELKSFYGEDTVIKEIKVERVFKPITKWRLIKILPWLHDEDARYKRFGNGNMGDRSQVENLFQSANFKWGDW